MDIHLLDEVLPVFEFSGVQLIRVQATPDQIFTALGQVTLSDMPLARALIWLRYLPVRILGNPREETPMDQSILESALRYYQVLAELPSRELVIGQVGRLDKIIQEGVSISSREAFCDFDHPDYQKYALGIRVAGSEDSQGVMLIIEHRLHALGPASYRGFARYWTVIGPVSAWMLRMLLGAIKKRAERSSGSHSNRATKSKDGTT